MKEYPLLHISLLYFFPSSSALLTFPTRLQLLHTRKASLASPSPHQIPASLLPPNRLRSRTCDTSTPCTLRRAGVSLITTTTSSSSTRRHSPLPLPPTPAGLPTLLSSSAASSAAVQATPMGVVDTIESAGGPVSFSLPRAHEEGFRMVDLGTSSSSSSASSSRNNPKQLSHLALPSMPAGLPSSSAAFSAAPEVTSMDVVPDADPPRKPVISLPFPAWL